MRFTFRPPADAFYPLSPDQVSESDRVTPKTGDN